MYYLLRKLTKILYKYQGTGLPRIAESIRMASARYGPRDPLLIEDFFGARFYCNLREHMGSQIFFRGAYSGGQLQVLKEQLPIDGVFLDIGANQGEFTVLAAQIMPAGKVIAFEPVTKNVDKLRKNIEINGFRNVEVVQVALGNSSDILPIYDTTNAFSDGSKHEGLQTLFPSEERSTIVEMITVRRLDDILGEKNLSRISLIKIDVEGAELFVLQGAKKTIERFMPPILIEINRETCESAGYHPEQIVDLLYGFGYELFEIGENGKLRGCGMDELGEFQNCLAIPATHAADKEVL